VTHLISSEIDGLLSAPDRSAWIGRREHALILLAVQTGLRVSELAALRCGDVQTGRGSNFRVYGKGRQERVTPLTKPTVPVLQARPCPSCRPGFDERAETPTSQSSPAPLDAGSAVTPRPAQSLG
jgi:integrase/recombinase XerD